jgi:beta-fructofuranosidase
MFDDKLYRTITRLIQLLPREYFPKGKIYRIVYQKIYTLLRRSDRVWDPWIFQDGDVYRLFYLKGPKYADPWWSNSIICSAVSTDMKRWKELGVVLEPDPENAWEAGRIFAGFTYKEDGVYYLFYSAAGQGKSEILDEAIGLATSTNSLYWKRYSTNPLLKPNHLNSWYGKVNNHFQWRDPYIVKDCNTDQYYMFISSSLKDDNNSQFRGCIGLAVADKVTGPYELLPPALTPFVEGTKESLFYEMERPQVIYKGGKYHLFFSCWHHKLNPKCLQKWTSKEVTNSSLYWYISDKITGPFKPASEFPVVRGSEKTGLYGTNFFPAPDFSEEFIAYGWYHRLSVLEVSPVYRVHWNDNSLTIRVIDGK